MFFTVFIIRFFCFIFFPLDVLREKPLMYKRKAWRSSSVILAIKPSQLRFFLESAHVTVGEMVLGSSPAAC